MACFSPSSADAFKASTIFFLLLPIVLVGFFAIVNAFRFFISPMLGGQRRSGAFKQFRRSLVRLRKSATCCTLTAALQLAATVVVLYVLHPTLSRKAVLLFACATFEDERYLPAGQPVPDWANVTSARASGGAWVVTESARYGVRPSRSLSAVLSRVLCAAT